MLITIVVFPIVNDLANCRHIYTQQGLQNAQRDMYILAQRLELNIFSICVFRHTI